MYHVQTFQFFFLLVALPLVYMFAPLYNNYLLKQPSIMSPLFEHSNFSVIVKQGEVHHQFSVPESESKTCFSFSDSDDIEVLLTDKVNTISFSKTVTQKHVNIALTTELVSPKHIPNELKGFFYYSPSHMLMSPGVIITEDDGFNKEMGYDPRDESSIQETPYKVVCLHNLTYVHFFMIGAVEMGSRLYNIAGVGDFFFDSSEMFLIFILASFSLICGTMFTRWTEPKKENLVLYGCFSVIFLAMNSINKHFTENPNPNSSINCITPMLYFSFLFLRYDTLGQVFNAIGEAFFFVWENFYYLLVPLMVSLVGCFFSTYLWFSVLLFASLLVRFVDKENNIITKLAALIDFAFVLLFFHWKFFNIACLLPFFVLLI
ncbi:hypothetical protein EIN_064520 [Entamoeba invadens IP1]|uniref:Uncharacterized protein n=1 Tax=Entamoeba invadens IP1 TaxID=370355 RepID=A0A0A1TV73_ENTIV|nr:hypothetical protein EIN_064520 [Entamoeba invadens IP1]ELP84227.1 hypothetical protein EIN_064520 [Entamoeba invadens IP1]|eukprot:XP_004183573.1 hypothetical protein EIN_064520 [Entamoeba invadens IP1]